jgi:WD40 repeat protein
MLLEGHRSIVHKMAFSPDVGRLASASFDGSLRLWDTSSGADITALVPTDGSRVSCITFSPDGQKLASGTEGGSLALWDARSGELLSLVLHTHDAEIFDVRFSGDGQRLLTASYDQIIRIWNVNLDTLEATEKDHSFGKYLQRVTFTPGEQGILSGRRQFLVHYDLETFTIIHSPIPPLAAPIMSIACSPIDAWFATGHHDGTVLTWDATSLTHKNILFMGNNYPVQGAGHTCFSASGTYLASKCYDVRLWHVTRDEFAEIRLTDAHRETKILAFSSDSRRLASMSEFDLRIWETSTGDLLQMMYNGRSLAVNAAVALSHDLNLVAMGNDRGTIQVCTPLTGGVNLEEPTSAIVALSFSPNGDFVATASHDASLKLWNTSTSELIWALESHHSYPLNSLVFSPDGLFVITVGYFDPMKIWNVRNGDEHILASSEVSQEAVKRIDFSDDGSLFALAFHSPILICIWNTRALVEQQDVLHELHGVPLPSNVMKFSSDNQLIALGLGSNIAVQHIINGTLLSTAAPNDAPIAQMAFSRMCDRLVTVTSYPYQIDLWSVTTELTHIAQIDFDNASPRAPLYIAPDSKYLVYGSLIWDITNPIPEPWTNRDLPRSLTGSTDLVQSLLSYGDGCIHFLSPPGRILLIPEHLGVIPSGDLLKPWRNWCAYGNTIALATRSGVPLIIDCSPMLRQMRPILADADDRSPLSSPGNATCRVIGEGT